MIAIGFVLFSVWAVIQFVAHMTDISEPPEWMAVIFGLCFVSGIGLLIVGIGKFLWMHA